MKRVLLLIAIVAAMVIGSKLLIENALGLTLGDAAQAWLSRAGTGSGLAIVALLGADLFLPIPSSLVMILSGAAFGVAGGSLLAFVGSVGGEWLGFELVRRYGRGASRLIVPDEEIARLEALFARHGLEVVVATRALPIAMETFSVVAAVSGMSRARFLLASIIGTLPIVVVYAWAGSVSRQTDSMVPAMVMLVAVAACGWVWWRIRAARRS
ncbi:MAG: TVP38/TMEM64 family protein [Acidobacteria bacterium]|nr:TVP38/TMEM64 family protein [Acidobacteriota bacterium]